MKRILLFFAFLLVSSSVCAPLHAQSDCFTTKVNNGTKAMNNKKYKDALRFFNEALNSCDDRNNHKGEWGKVRNLISKCNEKVNPQSKKEESGDGNAQSKNVNKAKKATKLTIDKETNVTEQVGAAATERTFTIATDASSKWTATSNVDFITTEQSKGNHIILHIMANNKPEVRQGTVTVSVDSLVATISIRQDAAVDTTPRVEISMNSITDVKQNQLLSSENGIALNIKVRYRFLKGRSVKIYGCFVDEQQRRIIGRKGIEMRAREQETALVPTSDDVTKDIRIELPYSYMPLTINQGDKIGVYFDAVANNKMVNSTKNLKQETDLQRRYYYFAYEAKKQGAHLGKVAGRESIKDNVTVSDGEYVSTAGHTKVAGTGLTFHINYTLTNMYKHRAVFAVLLFDKDGNPLKDEIDQHYNIFTEWANRHVATYDTLNALDVENVEDEYRIGIPYRQIPLMSAGKMEIKYKIAIFDLYEGQSKLLMVTPDFGTCKFTVAEKDVHPFLLIDGSHNRAVVTLSKESGMADTLSIKHNCSSVGEYKFKTQKLDKYFDIQYINNGSAVVIKTLYANNTGQTRGGVFSIRAYNSLGQYVDSVEIDLRQSPNSIAKTVKQKEESAPVNFTVERSGWNIAQAMSDAELNKQPWNEAQDGHWMGISFGYRQHIWKTADGRQLGPFSEWDVSVDHSDGFMGGLRFVPQISGLAGFGFDFGIFYEYSTAQSDKDLKYTGKDTVYRISPTLGDEWGGSFMEIETHSVYIPLHIKYNANFYKWFSMGIYGGVSINYTAAGKLRFRRSHSYEGSTLIKSYDIEKFYNKEYQYFKGTEGYYDPYSVLYGSRLGEKFTYPGGWSEINTTFDIGASLRLAMFQFDVGYSIGLTNWNSESDDKVTRSYPLTASMTILF